MVDTSNWDWEVGRRQVADLNGWRNAFEGVEEPQASPDGEKLAAVVQTDEAEFSVCEEKGTGQPETWEGPFDKVCALRYAPDGRLTAQVSDTGEWTVGVDGELWEESFDFVWDTRFAAGGKRIADRTERVGHRRSKAESAGPPAA